MDNNSLKLKYENVNNIERKPPPLSILLKNLNTHVAEPFNTDYPRIFISGKTGSGKTVVCDQIIDMLVKPNTLIVVFCPTVDVADMWKIISAKHSGRLVKNKLIVENVGKKNEFNNIEALIKRLESEETSGSPFEYIVVFDDISRESRNEYVKVFLKECRHLKSSCIILSQGIKDLEPDSIENLSHLILFKGISKKNLKHICDIAHLGIKPYDFIDMYKMITSVGFDFLLVDKDKDEFRRNFNQKITIA